MIDTLKKYNELFYQSHSHGQTDSADVFAYTDRASSLILTASHATRGFYHKQEKPADLYTGALVEYLGIENDISTLVRVKFTPYKVLISDYISEMLFSLNCKHICGIFTPTPKLLKT